MNLSLLLARLLSILYAGFYLLFAFGEGILQHGSVHLPVPVLVLTGLILFWDKPALSFLFFGILTGLSVWFYHTLSSLLLFLVITMPLAIVAFLNLGAYITRRNTTSYPKS